MRGKQDRIFWNSVCVPNRYLWGCSWMRFWWWSPAVTWMFCLVLDGAFDHEVLRSLTGCKTPSYLLTWCTMDVLSWYVRWFVWLWSPGVTWRFCLVSDDDVDYEVLIWCDMEVLSCVRWCWLWSPGVTWMFCLVVLDDVDCDVLVSHGCFVLLYQMMLIVMSWSDVI